MWTFRNHYLGARGAKVWAKITFKRHIPNLLTSIKLFYLFSFVGKIKAVIFEDVELFWGSTGDTIQKGYRQP
jgi:hypothetical protein